MSVTILQGDCLEKLRELPSESVHCCVTSPPYWGLRDYGVAGQIGLEKTPEAHVAALVEVFREVRRVLRKDGTLWLNYGDCYNAYNGNRGASTSISANTEHALPDLPGGYGLTCKSLKNKDLVGMPWRVAFALQADGWWLRSDIIWAKRNPMPESVRDRPTRAHEYLFLMTKAERYYYDADAIREPWTCNRDDKRKKGVRTGMGYLGDGLSNSRVTAREGAGQRTQGEVPLGRNKRTVWELATQPCREAHFATFPEKLVEPCILAGCPVGGTALDPFGGSGTTGAVATRLGRNAVLIELNPAYVGLMEKRVARAQPAVN